MATTKTKTPPKVTAPAELDPQAAEPLVDLDEDEARPTVRYGGALYELRTLNDFGIDDQQALTRDGREFFRLWSSDVELKRAQKQRLKMLLDRLFNEVFDAPAEIREQLADGKRAQVVLAFTLAPLARRTAELKAEAQATGPEQAEEARDDSTSTS